jgi:hypothetical protein
MTLQLANFVYILLMPLAGVRPDCVPCRAQVGKGRSLCRE